MAVQVASLDELSADDIAAVQAELATILQEKYPGAEAAVRGIIHDVLLHVNAIYTTQRRTEMDRLNRSMSLLEITTDPALADDEIADAVFSNYRVTREPGSKASGEVTVVVDANIAVTIPQGLIFTGNGQRFETLVAFTGRPVGGILQTATDRELQALGDGTFAFTIEVTATDDGTAGNLTRDTKLVPSSLPDHFLTAYASEDFTGGFAEELTADVLRRLEEGIAAKGAGNRVNIAALLRENFPRIEAVSIIGFSSTEMKRDRHWIWPMSGGGRVDVYVRSSKLPQTTAITKTASLVEITADGGIWQFTVMRDEVPGFYEVDRIVHTDAGPDDAGYNVTEDIRATDITDLTWAPDIVSAEESAYSPFQTAVIRFLDTDRSTEDLALGAQSDYSVVFSMMPEIADMHELLAGTETRNTAGDVLVKAAVPCRLSLNFEIHKQAGEAEPDTDAIKNALADVVNSLHFPGQLNASLLADNIHNFLSGRQALGAIDMFGRIRCPNGELLYVRDSAVIEIPDQPGLMVTGRTTDFILDPRDIGISIVNKSFAQV